MSTGAMPAQVRIPPPEAGAERAEESAVANRGRRWYFSFFFVSGFCSILYELIWLRLAMAQFGVTTAMVSIVLSSFMAGLGLGSWTAGHFVRKYARRLTSPPLQVYAIAELFIGCSAVVVPAEFMVGRLVLEHVGSGLSLSSSGYYVAAGVWAACSLIPWCACMGATIPLGMFALRSETGLESRRSFSFFYLANVLGAVAGALIPLLLIEVLGFSGTLRVGMLLNLAICGAAFALARKQMPQAGSNHERDDAAKAAPAWREMLGSRTLWLLFATGLTSMGMEVVWTRQYTIYIGTFVYSFATILAVYLAATFIGSSIYRVWSRRHRHQGSLIWLFVWLVSLTPLLTADPRLDIPAWLRVPLGIAAFSGLLGFLTPRLVDRFSEGDPNRAGVGYAVNVAGCVLGPLLAGFILLPHFDERFALVILALPWLLVALSFILFGQTGPTPRLTAQRAITSAMILLASLSLILMTRSYLHSFPKEQVRRDSTATVLATGEGAKKGLFVNGVNMTELTPATKMMASMPLAFLDRPPRNALVICFGMGTTHRTMLSWGIDSTVVDLVPSVPALFWYFHPDGPELLKSPRSHVVADDGRRFLERTNGQYDVIVIDPPPPIQAAGTSLLYSREFYSAAQKRLRPDGILQQWFPGADSMTTAAIALALKESFPYVRVFRSVDAKGLHYLASRQPIPDRSAADLARRMPASAAADLVEWGPFPTAEQQFAAVLEKEIPIDWLVAMNRDAPAMEDDRPVNEYYLLRDGWLH
ncbi:MAG TPA: fused MFS/spermidine synthase [Terriglobales bacterium]|nr:fused MFS/spermidine synthase [Terriglobales bacterium]